jgi:hypothetical protein
MLGEQRGAMAKKRIGILTGGGDVPDLNSVIKTVTYRSSENDMEIVGLRRGWEALTHLNLEDAKGDPEFGLNHAARRRGGCVAARGARPLVVRWVGALGCPSSSRRRNIKQSPQYGPHLLTVRKHGAAIMRASDDAATRNARRGWRNRVPAETGFASADAMQHYRCVPDPTWPQLSRLS